MDNALLEDDAPAQIMPDVETLISFGDDQPISWDPQTRTLKNCGYFGTKGHWTYPDTFLGNFQLDKCLTTRMTAHLVFTNDAMTEIAIDAMVRIESVDRWVEMPDFVAKMLMSRTEWGWARTTTAADISKFVDLLPDIKRVFPPIITQALEKDAKANWWNYPMVQIVDGDGKRTKHYDDYLQFMKRWGSDEQLVIARAQGCVGYCCP